MSLVSDAACPCSAGTQLSDSEGIVLSEFLFILHEPVPIHATMIYLVGGFNWDDYSHILWKIKNVPNHQPVYVLWARVHGSHSGFPDVNRTIVRYSLGWSFHMSKILQVPAGPPLRLNKSWHPRGWSLNSKSRIYIGNNGEYGEYRGNNGDLWEFHGIYRVILGF